MDTLKAFFVSLIATLLIIAPLGILLDLGIITIIGFFVGGLVFSAVTKKKEPTYNASMGVFLGIESVVVSYLIFYLVIRFTPRFFVFPDIIIVFLGSVLGCIVGGFLFNQSGKENKIEKELTVARLRRRA